LDVLGSLIATPHEKSFSREAEVLIALPERPVMSRVEDLSDFGGQPAIQVSLELQKTA
jgi:hypothetical protein